MSARSREAGTAAIELVLIAPALVCVFLLVVGLGRMAHARQQVESVAFDAARAASLERDASRSEGKARDAAEASLGDRGVTCRPFEIDVDLSRYEPGGEVRVRVECTSDMRDVALSGLPGSHRFAAVAVVPIEMFRGS